MVKLIRKWMPGAQNRTYGRRGEAVRNVTKAFKQVKPQSHEFIW